MFGRSLLAGLFVLAVLAVARAAQAAAGTLADSNGEIVAWGSSGDGRTAVPAGSYQAISGGDDYSLAIRADGTLAGWGFPYNSGELSPPTGTFTAVAAGGNMMLGIQSDRRTAGWKFGQYAIELPLASYVAIAAGETHLLGVISTGWVQTFGSNDYGERDVPAFLYEDVAAGSHWSLGLKTDGTLAAWGNDWQNVVSARPEGQFTAIAAGASHGIAIDLNGELHGWGQNDFGQAAAPSGTFSAVSGGYVHSLGLRSDGTLIGWGNNTYGQTDVPNGTFVAISAGDYHSLALRARTEYDGDLLVSGSGLRANLNRTVHVAGDARIESTMAFYNSPLLDVAGRITFAPGGGVDTSESTGAISAQGGVEVLFGATLLVQSSWTLNSGGPLMGSGGVVVDSDAALSVGLTSTSHFTGGLFLSGEGSSLSFTGAGLITPGLLQIGNNAEVRLVAGQKIRVDYWTASENRGDIQVLGNPALGAAELEYRDSLANLAGSLLTVRDATLRFGGTGLCNNATVVFTGGSNDVFGDVVNAATGSITVTGGATVVFYDDVTQNGALTVRKSAASTATAIFLGSLNGGYVGGGDVIVEGDLRPGNSPAAIVCDGNLGFRDSSGLEIELAGRALGAQYDHVTITGEMALAGTLDVRLIDGFMADEGDRFDVLDWGTRLGTFDDVLLPELDGNLVWDITGLYTTGELAVAPATPGDADKDGRVNESDAQTLAAHWGQTGCDWTDGDFNDDETVNAADASILAANWGRGTDGESSSVPEPAAGVLLVALLAALLGSGRRRRDLQRAFQNS